MSSRPLRHCQVWLDMDPSGSSRDAVEDAAGPEVAVAEGEGSGLVQVVDAHGYGYFVMVPVDVLRP